MTLWRNRDYRLLFGAQIISLIVSGVTTIGLALFAYELTGGVSATAVIGLVTFSLCFAGVHLGQRYRPSGAAKFKPSAGRF